MTTEAKPENITALEDAETVRWLTDKLAPARRRTLEGPATEAIARIRARVLEEASSQKKRKIAA
jgi:hypothetical protein